ncbi:hypothetical protein GW915_13515 [bacterium]|nr:hypothetical protein [bacterium]
MRAQKDFSDLNLRHRQLEQRMSDALGNRMTLLDDISKCQKDIGKVKLFSDLISTESRKMKMIELEISKQSEDLERYRSWVEHLHRELKVVENLENKQRAEFEEAKQKKDRKAVDGWVVERWSRKESQ